jgi:hypothetical protein
MIPVRTTFLAVVIAHAAAGPAAAQTGPTPADQPVITTLPRATVVAAGGGWTAWSSFFEGRYVLVLQTPAGLQVTAPVASRGVPFDIDIGTDAAGHPMAAYSRCTKEPTLTGGANATAPNYTSGVGCRIVLFDLATQKERKLSLTPGSVSDVLPSVAGSKIAYVAVPSSSRLKNRAQLRTRTASKVDATVLQTGNRRSSGGPGFAGGPANVDFDGKRVASVWRELDEEFHSYDSTLYVRGVSRTGKPKFIAGASNGEECNYNSVLAPTLTGSTVTWVGTDGSDWLLERAPLTGGATRYGVAQSGEPDVIVTSAVVDGARLVVAETVGELGKAVGATQVRQIALGAFTAKAPATSLC